jgi:hypothetical protein
VCALACVPLLAVGGAQADTITLGSSLTKSLSPSTLATSATLQQTNNVELRADPTEIAQRWADGDR